jgi:L-phenylalanine/L-methionine N-acetyltransferase
MIIRKAKLGDEKGIGEYVNEGLRRKNFIYNGSNQIWNKEKFLERRKEISLKKGAITFVAEENKKIIGSVTGTYRTSGRMRHRIDCGWGVHPDYQGKGIATLLMKELLKESEKRGLKRAEAELCVRNIGSLKLAQKLSFKIEGTKNKGMLLDNGKYVDTYILGRGL